MGDDHRPLHAQERRAADALVVEDLADPVDPRAQEQVRPCGPGSIGVNSVRKRSKMYADSPSKNLMTTLPPTASVTTTSAWCFVRSLPSTLPTKFEVGPVEELGRPLDPQVALALLLADRQQGHAGRRNAQDAFAEDRAHPGVLGQVLRARIGVCADVEEHERAAVRHELDRQGRPIDAGQPPQAEDRRGHPRARVTGGHDRVCLAALDEIGRDEDRGVLLARVGRAPARARPSRHLRRVDDRDVGGKRRRRSAGRSARRRRGSGGPRGATRA